MELPTISGLLRLPLFLNCFALNLWTALAEVAPPNSLPCFPGAYYRKAVSSFDLWTGIEGVITLPVPAFDPARTNADGYLDNPSVYLGGQAANQEIDAGLSWSGIRDATGAITKERKAFRIFWRNEKWHTGPAQPELTFFPGDTVRLRCETRERGTLKLFVQLVARGDRAPEGFRDKTNGLFQTEFRAANFGPEQTQQFKRVNAIDQVGREGKSVEATGSKILRATWREVFLLRGTNGIPMTPEKFTDMRCPNGQHIEVEKINECGERVSIFGGRKE